MMSEIGSLMKGKEYYVPVFALDVLCQKQDMCHKITYPSLYLIRFVKNRHVSQNHISLYVTRLEENNNEQRTRMDVLQIIITGEFKSPKSTFRIFFKVTELIPSGRIFHLQITG
jgi:hypothetical protein